MKIYSKRNFAEGLGLVLLGILLGIIGVHDVFTVKRFLLCVLCLAFGIVFIIRSISREMAKEDRIDSKDERNVLIRLKSRSKALVLTQAISFFAGILVFILAKTAGMEQLNPMGIGLIFSAVIAMVTELATTIYYENHN